MLNTLVRIHHDKWELVFESLGWIENDFTNIRISTNGQQMKFKPFPVNNDFNRKQNRETRINLKETWISFEIQFRTKTTHLKIEREKTNICSSEATDRIDFWSLNSMQSPCAWNLFGNIEYVDGFCAWFRLNVNYHQIDRFFFSCFRM